MHCPFCGQEHYFSGPGGGCQAEAFAREQREKEKKLENKRIQDLLSERYKSFSARRNFY